MSALTYLFRTTVKNRIKQMLKQPAQLILVIFVVAMLGLVLFTSGLDTETAEYRPMAELRVMILALYITVGTLTCLNGLSSGASFYAMADVNLLFVTPISQRRILFYGLIRQLGSSLFVGFFLLFQFGWLNDTYNLSFGGLLCILLGYCLTMFCGQLTSMVIYSFTSGNPTRQKIVRALIYTLLGCLALAIAIPVLQAWNQPMPAETAAYKDARLAAAVSAGDSLLPALFPFMGWLKAAVSGLLDGSVIHAAAGFGATAIYIGALVTAIVRMQPDFYEDVLKATEVSFSAITAAKQGTMREAVPANVKVGKTGLGAGSGPNVFFYKHKLERRRSRIFILDTMTLIWAVACIVFSFFMRDEGILPVFAFATYIQFFSTSTGRWVRELTKPFVYMIPEKAFRKLIGLCSESILQAAMEAAVVMIPVGLITSAPPLDIAGSIIARFSFALLFMSGYIVVERVFGQLINKMLIMFVLLISMVLLALPGIILGIVVGTMVNIFAALLVIALCNTGVAALAAFLCRNILDYAELNNK